MIPLRCNKEDESHPRSYTKMAPKQTMLLILISLFSLLLFTLYLSSPPLSSSLPNTSTSYQIQTPPPTVSLTIKLLTYDRLPSLSRCLHSLASARYPTTDKIHLHIFIDHFPNHTLYLHKLNDSRAILDFVDNFVWKFGDKFVHYRTANVGLQAQWLEAWWPTSDNDFAFVVEDDLEVSPLYYQFLRGVILEYYYNKDNFSPFIYGASLQRPRFVPGKHGNKMQLDGRTHLFLYQLVGTWGQLLFPRPWKEFRLWYDAHKTKGLEPYLDGMVTTVWYKKMGERIWTPWFIKFIHSRGYFNIYTNFLNERALSVSHRDAGVNYGKTAGPDSYLVDETSLSFNLLELPPLSNLKWFDFCFRQVLPDRVVRNFNELDPVLSSLHQLETIILVSLYGTSETIIRNLLCHFERVNIRNYIFMGPRSDFLYDLARRGNTVIDSDKFFISVGAHKSMKFLETSRELMKEILVKSYVIKKSLGLGYKTWVLGGDVIPLSNASFIDSYSSSIDFFSGKDDKLFFIRSSSSIRKLWDDGFISNVVHMVEYLTNKGSGSVIGRKFVFAVEKLLEKSGVKMETVDETAFGVNINADLVNETSMQDGKKIAFWSSDLGLDVIQRNLQKLNLWIVDEEFACTAVVCHRS